MTHTAQPRRPPSLIPVQALRLLRVHRDADEVDAAVRPFLAVKSSALFDRGHLYAWQQRAAQLYGCGLRLLGLAATLWARGERELGLSAA